MAKTEYRESVENRCFERSEAILKGLPKYMGGYYRKLASQDRSPVSIYTYLQRLDSFFSYLGKDLGKNRKEVSEEDLGRLSPKDIEEYLVFLKTDPMRHRKNREKFRSGQSLNNYLSALRSFFKYAKRNGIIHSDPTFEIEGARKKKREDVVHIDKEEEPEFLASLRTGAGLTKKENEFRTELSALRDESICMTILLTGVRVSELAGIDVDDVNFNLHEISVYRKEGKQSKVYMSDELEDLLKEYAERRTKSFSKTKEKALFVVTKGKYKGMRLSVRSIQNIVKKYARAAGVSNAGEISPHRLRATFAMDMIEATGDLSLTQQALSHESPSTTSVYIGKRERELKMNRNVLTGEKAE